MFMFSVCPDVILVSMKTCPRRLPMSIRKFPSLENFRLSRLVAGFGNRVNVEFGSPVKIELSSIRCNGIWNSNAPISGCPA